SAAAIASRPASVSKRPAGLRSTTRTPSAFSSAARRRLAVAFVTLSSLAARASGPGRGTPRRDPRAVPSIRCAMIARRPPPLRFSHPPVAHSVSAARPTAGVLLFVWKRGASLERTTTHGPHHSLHSQRHGRKEVRRDPPAPPGGRCGRAGWP